MIQRPAKLTMAFLGICIFQFFGSNLAFSGTNCPEVFKIRESTANAVPRFCEKEEGWLRHVSFEASGGYYKMPSELFTLGESDLTKSPRHLIGSIWTVQGNYSLNDAWSVGLRFFKIRAIGYGSWERSDTPEVLAQEDITGAAFGETNLDIKGLVAIIECRFLKDPIRPYVRVGGGVGGLEARFSGEFRGYKHFGPFKFPFTEPANDTVERIIPIVIMEAGLRYRLIDHLNISISGFWNTGYGAKWGLEYDF